MQIKQDILEIIERGKTEGNLFYLPDGQLDRKTYLEVNKVLTALGGKWKRKLKAHQFKTDISEAIDDVLLTGKVIDKKKEFQQFETPPNIVDQLIELAELDPFGLTCLEPSAGQGNIAEALRSKGHIVFCVELDPENVKVLVDKGFPTHGHDFLTHNAHGGPKTKYDRIVMNPPFTRQQDIAHVLEALTYLKDDGILAAVMSLGVIARRDKKTVAFWDRLREYDREVIKLSKGAFKVSGTMVNTIILKIGGKHLGSS